jgi:hypothetical protein
MGYSAAITRSTPSSFVFVIDQSSSMDEKMPGGRSKSDFVADVLNKSLQQLIVRCTRADGVRDYFDIGVVAYGGSGAAPGLSGPLASNYLNPLSAVANSPLRIEERKKKVDDGAGGLAEQSIKFPVWFEPRNSGGTPMCAALKKTAEVLVGWCDTHQASYPPTIIHVTDGQSGDGDPEQIAEALKQISTGDGACLLFNLHIDVGEGASTVFPSSESGLPDSYSRALFRMSSPFPPHLVSVANSKGYNATSESRFFGYRAGIESIADFFDIGTRADNLR